MTSLIGAQARLALKAAEGVEKALAIRAAKYTGRAKLDLLQSGLLKKAAVDHDMQAKAMQHKIEASVEVRT